MIAYLDCEFLGRSDGFCQFNIKSFFAGEAQGIRGVPRQELEGQDAHAHQVAPVDALVRLRYHGLHPQDAGALCGPVSGRAAAVLLAGQNDDGNAFREVLHGAVKDVQFLARRLVHGPRGGPAHHFVDEPDVGEGSPGHDCVVAPAGPVGVELPWGKLSRGQEAGRWAVAGDGPGGGDVVRGDRVGEVEEHPAAGNAPDGGKGPGDAPEEGRAGNVGAAGIPGVEDRVGGRKFLPGLAADGDVAVDVLEHGRQNGLLLYFLDGRTRGPDFGQEHGPALLAVPEGLRLEVDVEPASDGVCDHQQWGGQVIGPRAGVDAALKVSVAGQHAGTHQLVLKNGAQFVALMQ